MENHAPNQELGVNQVTNQVPLIRPLAANTPGGLGPHYRVQTLCADGKWEKHSIFRAAKDAESCAQELESGGTQARVVRYEGCAAAG